MTRRSLKLIQHLPAPAPLRLTERHGCGWDYVWLAWRQRAQIGERTRRACSPFHKRFSRTQDQPNKTEQNTSSSVTCRCLLPEHTMPGVKKNRIVSDFRHLEGVWNFRRIVFHASLQVESSCSRFFRNFAAALRDMYMTSVSARFQE